MNINLNKIVKKAKKGVDERIKVSYSINENVVNSFRKNCRRNELNLSQVVEELLILFNNEFKRNSKTKLLHNINFNDVKKVIKKYFWDVDFTEKTLEEYPDFVIVRVANGGSEKGYYIIKKLYGLAKCNEVIQRSSRCDNKVKNFWKVLKAND